MKTTETLDNIIKQYLSEISVSLNSIQTYSTYLKSFYRYCDILGLNKRELSLANIIEVLRYVEKSKSRNYLISLTIILKAFYRWMDEKNYQDNIIKSIRIPKRKKTYSKEALTDQEIIKLLSIFTRVTFKEKRDYAIVMMMLVNGLRCVEVSRIIQEDIIQKNNKMCLYIQRKGHTEKDSIIQIDEVYSNALEDYMSDPDYVLNESTSLFYNLRNLTPITRQQISRMVKDYMIKAGIKTKKLTAHSLRHTAAVIAFSSGRDIHEVQLFLGHTKSEVTEIYLKTLSNEIIMKNDTSKNIMNHINKLEIKQQSCNLLV